MTSTPGLKQGKPTLPKKSEGVMWSRSGGQVSQPAFMVFDMTYLICRQTYAEAFFLNVQFSSTNFSLQVNFFVLLLQVFIYYQCDQIG